MKIKSAEEFKEIWEALKDSPCFPQVEMESDQVWLDVLEQYPHYDYYVVQYFVSPVVMAKLAYSEDADVRFRVAMARRILPETFELLSKDKESIVRQRIACNPKCPQHILLELSKDIDEDVAELALEKLEARL